MTEVDENTIHDAEWSLIEDTEIKGSDNGGVNQLAKQVLDTEYISIFNSEITRRILRIDDTTVDRISQVPVDIRKYLTEAIGAWYTSNTSSGYIKDFQILAVGVACLHAFVQANYTGPFLAYNSLNLLPTSLRSQTDIS